MGKIFGISNLPVSTLDATLKPSQDLLQAIPCRKLVKNVNNKLQKSPLKDVFVKQSKIQSTISK